MYPSSNNNATFFGNYYNDNNHSKTLQDLYNSPSFSSFHLPSPINIPLEDEAVFCEFIQQQFVPNDHNQDNTFNLEFEMPNMESKMEEYSNNNELLTMNDGDEDHFDFNTDHVEPENSSPRKRLSKGDRHSKINTARGPRDRRMRLSLDVAKKLFGLQDLLGFDKASKTVDWLLTKSKTAIQELFPDQSGSFMDVSNSASSTSECEVMSGTADHGFMVMTGDDDQATNKSKSSCGSSKKQKEKVVRVRKCADFHHPLAKASRERARERARERTIEKRNNNHGRVHDSESRPYCEDQAMNQYANQLGSWSTYQENQQQSTGNWTLSQDFNYPHEHQFNDLQINVKAWKGYNN